MAVRKVQRRKSGVLVDAFAIDYRDAAGRRRREFGGFTKKAAERRLRKRLREAEEGTLDRKRKASTPFSAFCKVFREEHIPMTKSRKWMEWLTGVWEKELGGTPLANINTFRIQGFLNRKLERDAEGRITNATTVRHLHKHIRLMLNKAVDWGYLEKNPADGRKVKVPRKPPLRQRWLSVDEASRLVSNAIGDARQFFTLLLMTGLRCGEAEQLRYCDIREDECKAVIRDSKTGEPRAVPLNETALAAIRSLESRRLNSLYLFPNRAGTGPRRSIRTALKGACRRAGLVHGLADDQGVVTHTLRHTFRSWMAHAGVQERLADRITGHSTGSVAAGYTHFGWQHLLEAVRHLDSVLVTQVDTTPDRAGNPPPQVAESKRVGA